jgi:hypothetical protein
MEPAPVCDTPLAACMAVAITTDASKHCRCVATPRCSSAKIYAVEAATLE